MKEIDYYINELLAGAYHSIKPEDKTEMAKLLMELKVTRDTMNYIKEMDHKWLEHDRNSMPRRISYGG